uniref:Solute carrier family 13 member 5 n=1 Tax=Xenopus tropicalis TaxID=8364 RepID=A0A803KG43_XENTR
MAPCMKWLLNCKRFLILFITPLLLLPLPLLIKTKEASCAYCIILMAVYWCTEVIPLAVTALLPVLLFPMFGILESKKVCMQYLKDTNMLFVGGLIVAVAVEHWNLHKRIALKVLLIVGVRPALLMLGFMGVTAFLSMWISNTATTAMMVPIVQAVLSQLNTAGEDPSMLESLEGQTNPALELETKNAIPLEPVQIVSNGHVAEIPEEAPEKDERKRISKGMMLCVCYAASIGGTATLTGTGPNLVLKGQFTQIFPNNGDILNFASWFGFAFPNMAVMLCMSWFWLQFSFIGFNFKKTWGCGATTSEKERAAYNVIREEYRKLGPISYAESSVLFLFILLVLLWFTRDPGFVIGWATILFNKDNIEYVTDATVAVFVAFLLFILPASRPKISCCKARKSFDLEEFEQAEEITAVQDLGNSSSVSFSVVSEERLNLAVQLAKRDVKRKHIEDRFQPKEYGVKPCASENVKNKQKTQKQSWSPACGPKSEVTSSGARVYVYTADTQRTQPEIPDSPPTHDPGPGNRIPKTGAEEGEQEVKRLQKELHTYIQKIQELAQRERSEDVLDAVEEARGRIRQQERATRSARMLYVLQQQVKEIKDELEQLSPQKIRHTKKSRTMSRLAAAHRGAIRALQMFVAQLNEKGEQQLPVLYKDLGHLIRQLSLCTAKVETGHDHASSDLIISILQKVEDLNILLEEKISSHAKKMSPSRVTSRSPAFKKESAHEVNVSPRRERKTYPSPVFQNRETCKQKVSPVRRQLVLDHGPESLNTATQTEPIQNRDPPTPESRAALKSGLEALIQAGGLKGLRRTGFDQRKNKGVLLPQRPQGFRKVRRPEPSQRANFQAKTMAFMLKENRPCVREKKTPWVPPNPTSPPASAKRVNWSKQQKKINVSSPEKSIHVEEPKMPSHQIPKGVEDEAVRLAWLDSETARRMQELHNLYKEEISRIQSLRKELTPTNRLPTEDEKKKNIQPQQNPPMVASLPGYVADRSLHESDALCWELSSGMFLQDASTLDNMIQRMEEIEKHQEAVRQRFSRIVYADPEFWAQEEKERASAAIDKRPLSPHPIRITKPVGQKEPVVDILLKEPLEGDSLQVSKEELTSGFLQSLPPNLAQRSDGRKPITVPVDMLRSIKDYTGQFQRHLRLTSHEEVGSFNPWQISERLAEELLEEALDEVAAELQDVCEGYAEAVFTSEFLQTAS